MDERLRAEDRAIRATIVGNLAMTALGLGFALLTGSDAVLLDGIYSFVGLLVSMLTLYVAGAVRGPANEQYPFGFAPLEPLLNLTKGLVILTVSVFALFSSVSALLGDGRPVATDLALVYALAATAACFAVSRVARRHAVRSGSHLIAVEADSWLIDTLLSAALAVAFGVATLLEGTRYAAFVPYADPAVVVILTLGVLPLPLRIIRDAYRQVVGAVPAGAEAQEVRAAVAEALAPLADESHRLRLMRVGRLLYVQLYVVPAVSDPGPTLPQQDAVRDGLYRRLRDHFPDLALDVVFTGDPTWSARSVGADRAGSP